jgi:DNA-binding ferritin-like protein (Dps family)
MPYKEIERIDKKLAREFDEDLDRINKKIMGKTKGVDASVCIIRDTVLEILKKAQPKSRRR